MVPEEWVGGHLYYLLAVTAPLWHMPTSAWVNGWIVQLERSPMGNHGWLEGVQVPTYGFPFPSLVACVTVEVLGRSPLEYLPMTPQAWLSLP